MELTVKQEQERGVLGRKDYVARVTHKGATPTRLALQEALSKQLKAKKELVVVRSIVSEFGSPASRVNASVYKDQKALEQFEEKYVLKRHESKKGDAPEAPKEQPAKEEVKSVEPEKPAEPKAVEPKQEEPEKGDK